MRLMATPKTPSTDTIKEMCKAYKFVVKKLNLDHKRPDVETKFKDTYKNHDVLNKKTKKGNSIDDDTKEEFSTYYNTNKFQSVDDNVVLKKKGSFLSRVGSRRSHTPQARPTYLTKSESRRSTSSLRRTLSRSFSKCKNERDNSPIKGLTSESKKFGSEGSLENPQILRNNTKRRTNSIVFSQASGQRKSPSVHKQLQCTLEELFYEAVKTIDITKDVITCDGTIVQEEETLKVKLKPEWSKGTQITFEGKGDEKPGFLPADLILVIDEKRHPLFKRNKDDLEVTVEIPLVKALTGCLLSVPLLGGQQMALSFDDIIYPGYEKVILGQGMPVAKQDGKRGDLRITFHVKFPQDLSHEQVSMVVDILKNSSYS